MTHGRLGIYGVHKNNMVAIKVLQTLCFLIFFTRKRFLDVCCILLIYFVFKDIKKPLQE